MSETTAAARQLVTERVTAAFTGPIHDDAAHAITAYADGTLNDAWRDGFVRHVMDVIVEAAMAAAPLIEVGARADERAKTSAEIADAITAQRRTGITAMLDGGWNHAVETMAGVAREHGTGRPESHGDATDAHAESGRTSKPAETLSGAKPCGCEGECPSIFKPCPVCQGEVTSVAVDGALTTTYRPCGHVVPDGQEGER